MVVWSLAGDSRRAVFLHPPQRLLFEALPSGVECVLRFGIGLSEQVWGQSDGVKFQVKLLANEEEEELLFSELLTGEEWEESRWSDHEVPLPSVEGDSFSLILQTDVGPAGNRAYDHAAWSGPHIECKGEEGPAGSSYPLVLLVSVDTLRQDHLGVYGYSRATSPVLDGLAEHSLVFERAYAPSPYTLPSHASMLTGLMPSAHRAGFDHPEAPLPDEVTTVAELLAKEGYRTIGITAGGLMGEKFGFRQGFEEWHQYQRANLPSVLPVVFDALDDEDRPTFLFLHTYDVHGPYQQPLSHRYFMDDWAPTPSQEEVWQRVLASPYHAYQELDRFSGVEEVIATYDSGIRFVDSQLGRLFQRLEEMGLFDSSLIIVTSDHGESLFERQRYFGHSHTLTDEELRIPLIVKLPGAKRRGRVENFTELVDIAPLILNQLSIARPSEVRDHDPLSVERDQRWFVRAGSSHLGSVALRSERWKVVSPSSEYWKRKRQQIFPEAWELFPVKAQIYDLQADPIELENLFQQGREQPEEVRRLVSMMRTLEIPGSLAGNPSQLPPDTQQGLRALGYIQ